MDVEKFPGNSNKQKKEKDKKVEKVITGKVVKKKTSLFNKFKKSFFGIEEKGAISSYVINDVVIPKAKDMVRDMIEGSIDLLLYGDSGGRSRSRKKRNSSYISYSKYYDEPKRSKTKTSSSAPWHNYDEIILESRGDAEEVLQSMCDLIDGYGVASVADLYELVGATRNYTDNNYGWYSLESAGIQRVRDGYRLNLPKAKVID